MSEHFISNGLNPFIVIVRKLIVSFRSRILHSDNILVRTIVESMHFLSCKLTQKWNGTLFKLRV